MKKKASKTINFAVLKTIILTFFTKNILLKLFSLLISLLLYYYFESKNITERIISVPLKIETPQNLAIGNQTPEKVNVYISGAKVDVASFDVNFLSAQINITAKKPGIYNFKPIPKGNISPKINILRISPENVTISLEKASAKYVEVEPTFYGELDNNYSISYSISPKTIRIQGPNKILKSIFVLKTEPISIKNLKTDKDLQVFINKSTTPLIKYNTNLTFKVRVKLEQVESILDYNQPINIQPLNLDPRFAIKNTDYLFVTNIKYKNSNLTKTNTINISQTNTIPQELTSENVRIYINLADIQLAGDYNVNVSIDVHSDWHIVDFSPKNISLTIEDVTSQTSP